MSGTSRGRGDATARGAAGGLLADAVMDVLADALRHRTIAAPDPPDQAPQPPAPAMDEHRGAGVPAHPIAHAAQERLDDAVAALVSAVVSRLDVNAILDRVDVQRIVDRVDVQEVVQRIDLNEVLAEVDVDALLERVDVDQILDRVDVGAVVGEALDEVDIGEVVRESTASLGTDAVEEFRQQAMVADERVARAVDRLLRRSGGRDTGLKRPESAS